MPIFRSARIALFALIVAASVLAPPSAGEGLGEYALQPQSYCSPSGKFSLTIIPTERDGSGVGSYILSNRATIEWTGQLDLTLRDALVSDDGSFVGFAVDSSQGQAGAVMIVRVDHQRNVTQVAIPRQKRESFGDDIYSPEPVRILPIQDPHSCILVVSSFGGIGGGAGYGWFHVDINPLRVGPEARVSSKWGDYKTGILSAIEPIMGLRLVAVIVSRRGGGQGLLIVAEDGTLLWDSSSANLFELARDATLSSAGGLLVVTSESSRFALTLEVAHDGGSSVDVRIAGLNADVESGRTVERVLLPVCESELLATVDLPTWTAGWSAAHGRGGPRHVWIGAGGRLTAIDNSARRIASCQLDIDGSQIQCMWVEGSFGPLAAAAIGFDDEQLLLLTEGARLAEWHFGDGAGSSTQEIRSALFGMIDMSSVWWGAPTRAGPVVAGFNRLGLAEVGGTFRICNRGAGMYWFDAILAVARSQDGRICALVRSGVRSYISLFGPQLEPLGDFALPFDPSKARGAVAYDGNRIAVVTSDGDIAELLIDSGNWSMLNVSRHAESVVGLIDRVGVVLVCESGGTTLRVYQN